VTKLYAIFDSDEYEPGDLVAIATEQVVASMAVQAGFSVISTLPILRTTSEFIEWRERG